MSDPREVFLQPECCADAEVGRLWCEDDAPQDCEEGKPWTRYIIASEYERLRAEVAALKRMWFSDADPEETRWSSEYATWRSEQEARSK